MKKHIFTITIVSWIILDLFTKNLAFLFLQERINILWNFIYLEHVLNNWIAFSIQLNLVLLKIITISLIIWFFYYYFKEEKIKKNTIIDIAFWLILGWAIWNWIERVLNENVIDFIWVSYFSVFNLADSFIFIWVCLYLTDLYIIKKFNL